jgi:hypothetical protein
VSPRSLCLCESGLIYPDSKRLTRRWLHREGRPIPQTGLRSAPVSGGYGEPWFGLGLPRSCEYGAGLCLSRPRRPRTRRGSNKEARDLCSPPSPPVRAFSDRALSAKGSGEDGLFHMGLCSALLYPIWGGGLLVCVFVRPFDAAADSCLRSDVCRTAGRSVRQQQFDRTFPRISSICAAPTPRGRLDARAELGC